ncbi:MAG: hypothetical protein GF370_03175 [Candidatus Nealsonbacteria bacterium]|nr:hypothetical protein [Candidatus Nealsonbacteria bacterium]
MSKKLKLTFCSLLGMFLVVLAQFFLPPFEEFIVSRGLFLIPLVAFSLLGAFLLFFVLKEELPEKLRKSLFLMGASAAGFFIFVLLHNMFYALEMVVGQIIPLNYFAGVLHVISFLTAVLACPLGFLFGTFWTLFLLSKEGRKIKKPS